MKIDIARQPLVPAFMTLFALAVAAMCAGIPVSDTSGAVRDALPLLGGQLARFQAAYPVWSKFAAGFMLLFTGMCAGRITIRYNLYTVGTCLPIPLYAIVACGIATGGNYLAGFAASMLLALATKNYCRAFCNGYGFDAIFRASLYLGLMPLVYAPGLPMLLLLPLILQETGIWLAAAPAAGRTAFPAYLAGSRGSNGRTAAAGLHGLLCQLGHRGGIHGSPDQIGAIRHRRYAAASLSGYSPPRTRHGRRDRAARPDSAFLFPGRHLCRRHQTPLHPLL